MILMKQNSNDSRPPPVPRKYRREYVGNVLHNKTGLKKLKKDIEQIMESIDEIKQATFAGEYKFDNHVTAFVNWIDNCLQASEIKTLQTSNNNWNKKNLMYFFGMDKNKSIIRSISEANSEDVSILFFDPKIMAENILWEQEDVPMGLATKAAHYLNKRIIRDIMEKIDEIVTS